MATAQTTKPAATPKAKKEPVAVVARVSEQMKRATLGGKLSADELDKIGALAQSLKVFLQA